MAPGDVRVWEAWVDTGRVPAATPRWIGVRDGAFVPHRRAFLGGFLAKGEAEERKATPPVPLAGGPSPADEAPLAAGRRRHNFPKMLLIRLALVAGFALLSALTSGGGEPVTNLGSL